MFTVYLYRPLLLLWRVCKGSLREILCTRNSLKIKVSIKHRYVIEVIAHVVARTFWKMSDVRAHNQRCLWTYQLLREGEIRKGVSPWICWVWVRAAARRARPASGAARAARRTACARATRCPARAPRAPPPPRTAARAPPRPRPARWARSRPAHARDAVVHQSTNYIQPKKYSKRSQ